MILKPRIHFDCIKPSIQHWQLRHLIYSGEEVVEALNIYNNENNIEIDKIDYNNIKYEKEEFDEMEIIKNYNNNNIEDDNDLNTEINNEQKKSILFGKGKNSLDKNNQSVIFTKKSEICLLKMVNTKSIVKNPLYNESVNNEVDVRVKHPCFGEADLISVMNCGFKPTCFGVGKKIGQEGTFIAAGGRRGQLFVENIETKTNIYNNFSGISVNNAISISEINGNLKIILSSNDNDIKIYDINLMEVENRIKFPVPVNNSSISPDGTKLVACGDSRQVYIYDVRNDYKKITVLKKAKDHGFSCDWSPNSEILAVASQDGLVNLWDIRKLDKKPLAQLYTTQRPRVKGACRFLKFSKDPTMDLMFYSEQTNYVNIIDTRTFKKLQTIRLSNTLDNISGCAISRNSSSFYIGADSGIHVFDVDVDQRHSFPKYDFN
eukprot:TRINITY_DN10566_c0_g1_i1.p1 TRINITY_DN10566_c0_g1~~TRINITY_DN10566_c0_g1_i1.p1  ORF type:complete len:433 (+),score=116.84 TRINITY_DN10566_c0_g1_i1:54-1352(+)